MQKSHILYKQCSNVLNAKQRKYLIVVIASVFILSYCLLFYFQNVNETNVRQSLLLQQEMRQNQSTEYIANNLNSDLKVIMSSLKGLSDSIYLQKGLLVDSRTEKLMEETYSQINNTVDRMFIMDPNGIIKLNIVPRGEDKFIGSNLSTRASWVRESIETREPMIASNYTGLDGKNRIGATYPILNRENGDLIGIVGVLAPSDTVFSRYGNIYDVSSQFLAAYDKDGNVLVTPREPVLHKNVFSEEVRKFFNNDPAFYRLIGDLVGGKASSSTYSVNGQEVLGTGFPIIHDNKTLFGITVVTPTATIYSKVGESLRIHTIQIWVLLSVMTFALIMSFFLLYGWNKVVEKEVDLRTKHLSEANNRLEVINERLLASEKAKEEFISMVSHELRTPLTPIKAFSHMLRKPKYMEGSELNERQKKAVDSIIRNITSLETLVGDILDVYKIDLSRLKLNKTSIGVKELIMQNVDNLKSIADEKGVTVVADIMTKNNTRVFCDTNRIGQVFGNLIKNSVDFVKEKDGKIAIGADYYSEANEGVDQSPSDGKTGHIRFGVFWVNDNGSGIPHDKIDKMFSKFYQIDTALTRRHGGTGLGLVICKGIVEAHGGKIRVDKNYKNGC